MAFGQQCRDKNVKCHLLRSNVPLTPKEGYALQNGSQRARRHLNAAWKKGCHVTGSRTPAARAAKDSQAETQQAPCVALAPPSFTMNADATISTASGLLTPELLDAWIAHLPKLSLPDAVFKLPDIDLHNVDLAMECLGSTSLARTMKVCS